LLKTEIKHMFESNAHSYSQQTTGQLEYSSKGIQKRPRSPVFSGNEYSIERASDSSTPIPSPSSSPRTPTSPPHTPTTPPYGEKKLKLSEFNQMQPQTESQPQVETFLNLPHSDATLLGISQIMFPNSNKTGNLWAPAPQQHPEQQQPWNWPFYQHN